MEHCQDRPNNWRSFNIHTVLKPYPAFKSLSQSYYRYQLYTGIYMFETWEIAILNTIVIGSAFMLLYQSPNILNYFLESLRNLVNIRSS